MMTTEVKTIRQKIERRTMDELSRDEGLECLRVGVGKSIHYFAFCLKYFLQENDPSRAEGEPVLCLKMHVDGFESKIPGNRGQSLTPERLVKARWRRDEPWRDANRWPRNSRIATARGGVSKNVTNQLTDESMPR